MTHGGHGDPALVVNVMHSRQPNSPAVRRAAALVCAQAALDQPDVDGDLRQLLAMLGLDDVEATP